MPMTATKPNKLGVKCPTPLVGLISEKIGVGKKGAGVVELTVPSQQYRLKHCLQTSGTAVLVRFKLLDRIAQPTQVGHCLSTVPFPMVATSYPFSMMALRSLLLYDKVKVDTLEL